MGWITYFNILSKTLWHWKNDKRWEVETVEAKNPVLKSSLGQQRWRRVFWEGPKFF